MGEVTFARDPGNPRGIRPGPSNGGPAAPHTKAAAEKSMKAAET